MQQPHPDVEVILGTGNMGSQLDPLVKDLYTPSAAQACLDLFRRYGFNHIDTARLYSCHDPGTCERLLGRTDAGTWALIDSKVYADPTMHRERILGEINASLQLLEVPCLNICYLHGPDRSTPFAEQCRAMDDAHKAGKFRHFGISNFSPAEVEHLMQLCAANGWLSPSVYQGHYNAISRTAEEELLPVLRKHGIRFFAYSPAAGGSFSGTKTGDPDTRRQGNRWREQGRVATAHRDWYHSDAVLDAAYRVSQGAEQAGLTGHAVSLRWILHHSALSGRYEDAIVLGGSSLEQVEANLDACTAGPLPELLVGLIDDAWEMAKESPPPAWV
ncbi:hypothetical protein AK830_g12274 [Neonectria ditissima]|uniref:NADP-dependent oxidoreductase domain-containing protein n=1 Tax=Neonectria ditissima TaxID=78410 RepID=A0A0P7AKG9_9HYPO|nr:hypothetical protein AK830_g12274 [Neonectria ditissima]